MRAVFVDCTTDLIRVFRERSLEIPHFVDVNEGDPSESELIGLCSNADVMLVEHTEIPSNVLKACPSVRAIVFMGTGAGTYVDLQDAAARGVKVFTTPGYGDRAVAEHAVALMFAAARQIAEMDRAIRAGDWLPRAGIQLAGQKIAVLGLGGIGTCVADIASALGMKVAAWNRSRREHPAFVADLDDALARADFVSLHLTLNEETRGLLDRRRLLLPKAGFVIINTARAALVEEEAMLQLLGTGQIGHAALDVFHEEPLPTANPYVARSNVTLTAHAAYMTDAAYHELWLRTMRVCAELNPLFDQRG